MNFNYTENNRIQNINYIMEDIHDSSNQIYEYLIDKENEALKLEVNVLIRQLKLILESIEDEI